MGIEKTELKIAFLHDRGMKTEDAKEAMEKEFQQTLGAIAICKHVQNNLANILRGASEDLHATQEFTPVQLSKILRYLQRCVDSVVSTSTQAGVEKIRIEGKVALLQDQINALKKELDAEKAKLELQKNPPPQEENSRRPPARIPGVHPGESLKNRRLREETGVLSQDAIGTAPTLPPEPAEPVEVSEQEAVVPALTEESADISTVPATAEESNGLHKKARHRRVRVPL